MILQQIQGFKQWFLGKKSRSLLKTSKYLGPVESGEQPLYTFELLETMYLPNLGHVQLSRSSQGVGLTTQQFRESLWRREDEVQPLPEAVLLLLDPTLVVELVARGEHVHVSHRVQRSCKVSQGIISRTILLSKFFEVEGSYS